jgi:hypothetical protein
VADFQGKTSVESGTIHERQQAGSRIRGTMLQLPKESQVNLAEVLTVTVCRLITWGTSGREACALANIVTLERDTPDTLVEQAVIEALVDAST